jgi:hypothetical protein
LAELNIARQVLPEQRITQLSVKRVGKIAKTC